MKTRRVLGSVAVAFACGSACGGSAAPSIPVAVSDDGGATDGGGLAVAADGSAGAEGQLTAGRATEDAGDGAASAASNAGPSQYCCVGGAYYACPTMAALQQCTGFDVGGCFQSCAPTDLSCTRACGQKASTAHTDPSACMHVASNDATCAYDAGASSTSTSTSSTSATPGPGPAPAPTTPPTPKNACGGYFLGTTCGVGGQCIGGGHCTQNKCYPNDVGNPCTFANDCGNGNHCSAGCCASPAKGSACATAIDCTSFKCTSGVCQ